MRFLIYLRVSTKDQDLRTQLDHCLRYLNSNFGEVNYKVFSDKITSRKTVYKREGSKALLSELRQGDTIVLLRIDRLSRKQHHIVNLMAEFERKNIEVITVDQPGLSKNKMLLGIFSGAAEEELVMLSKRTKEKFDSKRKRGERVARFAPYGYKIDTENLVTVERNGKEVQVPGYILPEESEKELVEKTKEFFSKGWSYTHITNELNELGFRNRNGKKLQKMTIFRIVKYAGLSRPELYSLPFQ